MEIEMAQYQYIRYHHIAQGLLEGGIF